jgi:NADH:ubiquinone oxidoreductase subunit F (NADH-binding)
MSRPRQKYYYLVNAPSGYWFIRKNYKTDQVCARTLKSAIRKARKSGPGAEIVRYRKNLILKMWIFNGP